MKPWQPILSGALHDRAQMAITAITEALHHPFRHAPARAAERWSGQALLHHYLYLATQRDEDRRWVERSLEEAIAGVQAAHMSFGLHGGFTNVAWIMQHVDPEDGEALEAVDEALLELLAVPKWNFTYDLIMGLAGMAVYFAERLPHPAGRQGLEKVVEHLLANSEATEEGLTWYTPYEQLSAFERKGRTTGYYNLGIAHGVPGAMGALATAVIQDVGGPRVRQALGDAMRWLWAQRVTDVNDHSTFGYTATKGNNRFGARAAWCYGDPGVASVLWPVARLLGEGEEEALAVARKAARRPDPTREIVDGGLCHGAAGLGHIFNRLYQETGEALFRDEAQNCFARLLEMRSDDATGVAGFKAVIYPREGETTDGEENASFLTGAIGIALSLHAATSTVEPQWDRMLMSSLREKV